MKTFMAAVFAITSLSAMSQDTYKVDHSATKITYVGKKVTGQHTGNVKTKSGFLKLQDALLAGGEIVVDMNTITSTDLADPEYNKKYVTHMKSEDFFNTAKYPDAKLVIKSSKKTDKGLDVKGDLTMVGQTKPVSFVVTDLKTNGSTVTGKTNLKLNRTLWGLKYGSGSFFKGLGDKAINDEFTLDIELTAKK